MLLVMWPTLQLREWCRPLRKRLSANVLCYHAGLYRFDCDWRNSVAMDTVNKYRISTSR